MYPIERQKELFTRLTPSYQGIFKGAGLGLSIVKQFVDDVDGEIYIESRVNQGTKFICLMPLKESLLQDAFGEETDSLRDVDYLRVNSIAAVKQPEEGILDSIVDPIVKTIFHMSLR